LTVVAAFYFENSYRVLVRFFFKYFQGDKVKFVGKNFHLFASPYFVVAFGLFSVLLTMLLYGQSNKRKFIYLLLTIAVFFITTIATTYIDSFSKVVECTACQDGIRSLHFNSVNYDFHFITSLVVGLLPLLWTFLKRQFLKRRQRKPAYNIGIAASGAGR
jgi:branched-subunit amino acid ABC-type transport system permease component